MENVQPEVIDERKLEGGLDFSTVLLYHLNRCLECLKGSKDDFGFSFLNSVEAFESIIAPYSDAKFRKNLREIERKLEREHGLTRQGKRIALGKAKLQAISELMYRNHLLAGDVNATSL